MKASILIFSILCFSFNLLAAPVCGPGSGGMTYTEGSDGVRVVYPTSGWTYTEGRDGRRVVYPTSGWTYTEGGNGRRVVYPTSGWTYTEGRDGRRVAYPSSGWTYTEGSNGRRVVYPTSGCQDLCSIFKTRLPNLESSEFELVLIQMGSTPCSNL